MFLLRQNHRSWSTELFIVHEQYILSVHTKRVAKCRALIDTRLYQREDQCMYERHPCWRYLSATCHQDVVRNNQNTMQRSIEHVDDATREHNVLSAFIRENTFLCSLQQIACEAVLDQAMLGSSFRRADALWKLCPAC